MTTTERLRVAVLFGGRSLEHEISVITAYQVMEAFDSTRYEVIPVYIDPKGLWYTGSELRQRKSYLPGTQAKTRLHRVSLVTGSQLELQPIGSRWAFWKKTAHEPIDVIFPCLHGSFGEDGCLQGMFEVLGIPYVGSPPLAASIAMHKQATKTFASSHGIPVLPGMLLQRCQWDPMDPEPILQDILQQLTFPLIIKPCNLGSSIGVSSAQTKEQLLMGLAAAFVLDHEVIVEPLVEKIAEYNVAVLSAGPGQRPRVSAVERPRRQGTVLSFEQKYLRGHGTKKIPRALTGMAELARDLNPKDVREGLLQAVRDYASHTFSALGLRGSPRFDFLYDEGKGALYLNEINPMPGSCAFYLWEGAEPRICFTELLHDLVQEALAEFRERNRSQRSSPLRIFHPEPLTR